MLAVIVIVAGKDDAGVKGGEEEGSGGGVEDVLELVAKAVLDGCEGVRSEGKVGKKKEKRSKNEQKRAKMTKNGSKMTKITQKSALYETNQKPH